MSLNDEYRHAFIRRRRYRISGAGAAAPAYYAGYSRVIGIAASQFDTNKMTVYSDDGGATWTSVQYATIAEFPTDGCYDPDNNRYVLSCTSGKVWYGDGTSWTNATPPAGTNHWRGIAYSPTLNLYAMCSSSGTNRIATSTTGIDSWTLRASADDAETWYGMHWDDVNEAFVSYCGFDADRIQYSTDGVTWNLCGTTFGNGGVSRSSSLAGGGGIVFNGGAGDGNLYTTDGGATATLDTANGYAAANTCVGAASKWDGTAQIMSTSGNKVFTATDGITWTDRGALGGFYGIAYDQATGRFVAGKNSDANIYWSDDNGASWTGVAAPTGWSGVSTTQFVAGGTG